MWSGLKNALEMFHSFSMARPWSEENIVDYYVTGTHELEAS